MRVWLRMSVSAILLLSTATPCFAAEGHGGERNMFEQALDLGLWTLVVFLILLLILSKFAWKPILQGLEKREQDIAAAIEEAKKTREKTAELQRQIEADRQRTNDDARQIREDARKAAEQLAAQRQALQDAKMAEDRERLLHEISVARDQVLQETFAKLAELATVISSKAIRRQVNVEDHRALVEEAIGEMNRAAEDRQRALAAGGKGMTASDEAVQAIESARARLSADATAQRVARIYAEALYEEADKRNAVQSVLEELELVINEVATTDPLMRNFFLGGIVGRDRRREALTRAFTGKLSDLALHFLLVLNEHERLELLRSVVVVYRQMLEVRSGQVRVLVWTGVPLPDDQRERLLNHLRQVTRREPVLQTRIDPDMLGGLIVQVGDWRYDASVRHQLEIIRNKLIESSSHEIQAGRDRFSSASGN